MSYEAEKIKNTIIYFLIIILSGCVLANAMIRCGQDVSMFYLPFSDYAGIQTLPARQTFFYVMIQRAKQLLIVYLLYKVLPGQFVFRTIMTCLLFFFGFVVSCQMYYLGLQGVIWLMLCLFPHYLVYMWLLYHMYRYRDIGREPRKFALYIGIMFACFLIGVLAESIVSRIFLKNFLQYIDF